MQKIPELQKEIELLQTQKLDVEKQAHSQKRELRGKIYQIVQRTYWVQCEPGQFKLISSVSAVTKLQFPFPSLGGFIPFIPVHTVYKVLTEYWQLGYPFEETLISGIPPVYLEINTNGLNFT